MQGERISSVAPYARRVYLQHQRGSCILRGSGYCRCAFETVRSVITDQDCEAEESRVDQIGGEEARPKTSFGELGFVSLANDTEGNTIGVHSTK